MGHGVDTDVRSEILSGSANLGVISDFLRRPSFLS